MEDELLIEKLRFDAAQEAYETGKAQEAGEAASR